MSAYLKTLRLQHWDARPLGERRAILIGASFALPLLAYFLLWQPAHDAVGKLHEKLPQLRIQAEQMRRAGTQVEEIRHRPQLAVMDALAVKTAVEESASRHQLRDALTTLIPQEPNGVRLTVTSVSFEKWLIWLRELQSAQHIRVDSITVTQLAEPGMVAIRATLTNGNTL
ncbi:MAG: type II secretion system protein M [Gallionella sp.]|nr:type II secretion system protein M [Gallionella sp.]